MLRTVALLLSMLVAGCSGVAIRHSPPGHFNGIHSTPVLVAQQAALPASTGAPSSPTPLQGISGEGLGNGIPRAVLQLVPRGATTVAEAGAPAATGKPLVAGGAVVAAGGSVVLVCLTVKAAMDGVATPIDIADSFYGTHFGDIQGWVQGCYAPKAGITNTIPAHTSEMKPVSGPHSSPAPLPAPEGDRGKKRLGRLYATYTKFNSRTHRYYSGRTSMVVDLNRPLRPQAEKAVDARDSNHHVDENDEPKDPGFRQAVLDQFDSGTAVDHVNRYSDIAYWRIRGREQQLIDSFGGAQSETRGLHRTENLNRGVAKDNPLGRLFHDAATKKWGQLYPYTGD